MQRVKFVMKGGVVVRNELAGALDLPSISADPEFPDLEVGRGTEVELREGTEVGSRSAWTSVPDLR